MNLHTVRKSKMVTQEILDAAMYDVVWRHDAKGRAESLKVIKQYIKDQAIDIEYIQEKLDEIKHNLEMFPDGG